LIKSYKSPSIIWAQSGTEKPSNLLQKYFYLIYPSQKEEEEKAEKRRKTHGD